MNCASNIIEILQHFDSEDAENLDFGNAEDSEEPKQMQFEGDFSEIPYLAYINKVNGK